MNWDLIIWKAIIAYFHWAVVAGVYAIARIYVIVTRKYKTFPASKWEKSFTYMCCVAIIVVFSWFYGSSLGTHHGEDPDDPSNVVVDFEPTNSQRYAYEAKIALVLLPASLFGLHKGYSRDRKLTPAERFSAY